MQCYEIYQIEYFSDDNVNGRTFFFPFLISRDICIKKNVYHFHLGHMTKI